MFGYVLTEDNKELLRIIYSYGGYTRISHIEKLHQGLSHVSLYNKLNKLENMKYLTSRRLKSNSKKEQNTYQVTAATCKLFNNPDSYFKKWHIEEYIYRALIKNYFLCTIHKELKENIVTDNEKKISLFVEESFNKELLPRKYNGEESFIQVEETLIDFTKCNNKKLLYSDEVLFDDSLRQIIVVYIDQTHIEPKKQMISLINKYIALVRNGGNVNLNFLIVVDDEAREKLYKNYINKFLDLHEYIDISPELLRYYKDFLLTFNKNNTELCKKISDSFDGGNFKKNIMENVMKITYNKVPYEHEIIISNVKSKGKNYILERVEELANEEKNRELLGEKVEKFFNILFLLEYNKYISFSKEIAKKFDLKVYKIDKKIHEM